MDAVRRPFARNTSTNSAPLTEAPRKRRRPPDNFLQPYSRDYSYESIEVTVCEKIFVGGDAYPDE